MPLTSVSPQTRRRLILRAVQGSLVPMLPPPESWVGWYDAIEDLIPTLPESRFAPWQLARLPKMFDDSTILVDSAGYVDAEGRLPVQRDASEPANTVVANHARRPMRAFIVDGQNAGREKVTIRQDGEPTMTVADASKAVPRAFLVGGQFSKPDDGSGEARPPQVRSEAEPVFTVTAENKGDWRAWLCRGRVVKMTPRALARFQSFPDSYILPNSNKLACKVIGNAVPPLMYQKLAEDLTKK